MAPAANLKPVSGMRWVRVAVALGLIALLAVYAWLSRGWSLAGDAQVIHYVCFLMDHGFAPYRQVRDMNMPGAYLSEHMALSVFGASDAGWRAYDVALGCVTAGGMALIARGCKQRGDWLAGLAAAVVFTLTHAADGPYDAGQRDQVIMVLLVWRVRFLFEAVRQRRAWLLYGFGGGRLPSAL